MKYTVNIPEEFWRSAKRLKQKYTHDEFVEIIEDIRESIVILAESGTLPPEYNDHLLRRSPYVNYNEYHVYDDDVLIIYYRHDKKLYLRFVEVIDHETLSKKVNKSL